MSHQHHFLSRLDRLSLPHVELALSLYRDPGLVRFALHEVRLPEGALRVALSLDDPDRGPFIVVTRDGIFVTCLGRDMSPGDLPVVTRGQLDAMLARAGDYRARFQTLAEVTEELGGGNMALFRRLYNAGENLSREEIIAASALQPLYTYDLFTLLVDAVMQLDRSREVLLPLLRRANKLGSEARDLLRLYWNTAWLVGHLTVLAGMSGPELFDKLPADLEALDLRGTLTWGAVRQGNMALALRGAWLAARVGKPLVQRYKQRLTEAKSILTALDTTLGLAAIALRHSRLRAEIEKALATAAQPFEADPKRIHYPGTPASLAVCALREAAENPEELEAQHAQLGAGLAVRLTARLPKDSPHRFERPEDVPRDLALTLVANATNSLITDAMVYLPLYTALPWVARASAEDLYQPRDFVRAVRVPWEPRATYELLRPLAVMYKPVPKRPEGPARKGPCPCGSGEKYKRCCGADA